MRKYVILMLATLSFAAIAVQIAQAGQNCTTNCTRTYGGGETCQTHCY